MDDATVARDGQGRQQPSVVLLQCPTCVAFVDGTREAFRSDNLNMRTWCRTCKRSRFVRLWRCRCGLLWHICSLHAKEPDRLRAQLGQQELPTDIAARRSTAQPVSQLSLPSQQLSRAPPDAPTHSAVSSTTGGTRSSRRRQLDGSTTSWLDAAPNPKAPRVADVQFTQQEVDRTSHAELLPAVSARFQHLLQRPEG